MLGPLVVTEDGRPLEVGGVRLRALMIRLALDAGSIVATRSLVDALWGSAPPADEANALQSLVSRLRRILPDRSAIASTGGGYRLVLPVDDVDARHFERLARHGRRQLDAGEPRAASETLFSALQLWRGPALTDAGDAPFVAAAAARLEELRLTAREDRIDADIALGRHAAVVGELESLAAEYPLRERLRAALVTALYAVGRQADALTTYEQTRRMLADELGVDPGPQLQAAYLAVLRGEPAAKHPEQPTPVAPRHNLRSPLTSFVGRDEEVERIGKLLGDSRLITLVGPGGGGKTRLAAETGARAGEAMHHGVWMVELASVTDPGDVPQAVLGALGPRDSTLLDLRRQGTSRDVMSGLLDSLVDAQALLILDNCEHVIDAAATLADQLLGRCPDLRILATSREPLAIVGETLLPVTPLARPAVGGSVVDAMASPAVRLFSDRAAAVAPGFAVEPDNVEAVIEICRRLDGLPLAIELAAARLRSMSVQQIAARLGDRFRLLTGGSRTAVPRHRTLRAVVEWSWDLLSDPERRLASRLAVFPAGTTVESAEAVSADVVPAGQVPDLLAALVDRSLLLLVDGDPPRYRMLETIREFGAERLADEGSIADVQARHAGYFRDLAETADPFLRGADQLPWLARLSMERENLLAALRYAIDAQDAATAIRLGAALSWFWTLRGSHGEAASWLEMALAVPGESPTEERAVAATVQAISAMAVGQQDRSRETAIEMLESFPDFDARNRHPVLSLVEPGMAMLAEDIPRALRTIERGLANPDRWTNATLRMLRGFIAENQGDVAQMVVDLTDAARAFDEIGERWGLSNSVAALANQYMNEGDLDRSLAEYQRALRLMTELNAQNDRSFMQVRIAMVRARRGEMEEAKAELRQIAESTQESGSGLFEALAQHGLGEIARLVGDPTLSRTLTEGALSRVDRSGVGPPQAKAIMLAGLVSLDLAEGDLASAGVRLREATALATATHDMPVVAVILIVTAEWTLRADGDAVRAAEQLGAATALRGTEDVGNPDAQRLSGWLRDRLGDDAYDEAYRRGSRLERDDALALLPRGGGGDERVGCAG
jgi:predicted ATPase